MAETIRITVRMDRKAGKDSAILNHATIVFVDEVERNGDLGCWSYVGQHGTCSRGWILNSTRLADNMEAAAVIEQWRSEGPSRTVQDIKLEIMYRLRRQK